MTKLKYTKKSTDRALTSWGRYREGQVRTLKNISTERGTLTLWRRHRGGQVRTWKESHCARGTHYLETALGGTSRDTERILAKRGALTSWRRHREGQVRTRKEFDRTRGTHILDAIGRDKLGHGENPTERGAPTNWRRHRKGHVKTWKESDRARGAHILETALGGISQDTERIQSSEAYILETASGGTSQGTERIRPREVHLPTGDGIERDKSGYGKARIERSTHLLETASGETVRARKESHRAKGTYQLETASGGIGQDMERIRLSEALTLWRRHREGQVKTWE